MNLNQVSPFISEYVERERVFFEIHRNDLGECGFRYTNPQISHFRQRIREFSCTEWNLCKFVRFISERRIYFNTFIRVCYSLQFDSRLSSSFDDGKLFIKQTIFIYRVYMIGLCVLGWRPFSTTLSERSNHLTYTYISITSNIHTAINTFILVIFSILVGKSRFSPKYLSPSMRRYFYHADKHRRFCSISNWPTYRFVTFYTNPTELIANK